MAGVNVEARGPRGRRGVDAEISLVPMIDFLVVTIAFLLITAVWTQLGRIPADAAIGGPPGGDPQPTPKTLHVEAKGLERFVLSWRDGKEIVERVEVAGVEARVPGAQAFPELAKKVEELWLRGGTHRDASDRQFDHAVLHADDATSYGTLVGMMDAVTSARRPFRSAGRVERVPAFALVFATE